MLLAFSGSLNAADEAGVVPDPVEEMQAFDGNQVVPENMIGTIPQGFFDGPLQGDLALEMTRQLLGSVALEATKFSHNDLSNDAGDGGGITLITYLLSIMAIVGMIMGLILAAYWLLMGLTKQNVDGEFLGKEWDSYMVPLRTAISIIGMQPFPGFGGLAFVQVGVLSLMLFGLGMGSAVLRLGAEFTINNPTISIRQPDHAGFVKTLFESKMCNEYHIRNDAYGSEYSNIKVTQVTEQLTEHLNYLQKYDDYSVGKDGVCGKLRLQVFDNSRDSNSDVMTVMIKRIKYNINQGQKQIILQLWRDFDQVINFNGKHLLEFESYGQLSSEQRLEVVRAIDTAYSKFKSSMKDFVKGVIEEQNSSETQQLFLDKVKELGWAYAGSLHYPLLMRAGALESATSTYLSFPSIDDSAVSSWIFWSSTYQEEWKNANAVGDSLVKDWLSHKTTYDFVNATEIVAKFQLGDGLEGNLSSLNGSVTTLISNLFREVEGQPDPLLEVASMGRFLEGLGTTFFLVESGAAFSGGAAASLAAGALGNGGIRDGLQPFLRLIMVTTYTLFAMGFFYAQILPAMPYIMWNIAVMGYFMYALAVFVAAPAWWALLAHPDGKDAMGKAASGVPIVVNLTLKPVLMVIGMFVGMSLLKVVGWLIDATFFPTVQALGANSGFILFKFIGQLAIYGLLMLIAIYKSYSLTWELPALVNQILNLSGGPQDMGESEAQGKTLVLAGMLSSNLTQLTSMVQQQPDQQVGPEGQEAKPA
ncbi:DotA/TraY family protein [Shewanella colwelliana]|uniref:DotA/TraY family protein n=1 Tax=Shewanella colwelliana TaxID=23 RepID=UPI0022B003A4|nr:DotA/TraY family protein [Shewanella colwelliana]MCZ4337813.1 DotA/TraY family protein [Shewanella colwelliana]